MSFKKLFGTFYIFAVVGTSGFVSVIARADPLIDELQEIERQLSDITIEGTSTRIAEGSARQVKYLIHFIKRADVPEMTRLSIPHFCVNIDRPLPNRREYREIQLRENRVCVLIRDWKPPPFNADAVIDRDTAITVRTLLNIAISAKDPPLAIDERKLPDRNWCNELRKFIVNAAMSCRGLSCMRVTVAASVAEKRCFPLKEIAIHFEGFIPGEVNPIWFDEFTALTYNTAKERFQKTLASMEQCVNQSPRETQCLKPVTDTHFFDPDQWAFRKTPSIKLTRSVADPELFNYEAYLDFLKRFIEDYKKVLPLFPNLDALIQKEIASLHTASELQKKDCETALAEAISSIAKTSEKPTDFFRRHCLDSFLPNKFWNTVRTEYEIAYSEHQEAVREKAAAFAKLQEEKLNSRACKITTVRIELCEYQAERSELLSQLAYQKRLNRVSGTIDLVQMRELSEDLLQTNTLIKERNTELRQLGAKQSGSCDEERLKEAQERVCTVADPREPTTDTQEHDSTREPSSDE